MISDFLNISEKSCILTKSYNYIKLWIQAGTFLVMGKSIISIFCLHFWLPFVPYTLSIYCLRFLSSIKLTWKKIHFSLKCFSRIPLKYRTSCSSCCCLKPRVGKIHSCPANGFFYKQRVQSLYSRFSPCCNAWRKSLVGFEKEDIWKCCIYQHTQIVMEWSWNMALFIEMLEITITFCR